MNFCCVEKNINMKGKSIIDHHYHQQRHGAAASPLQRQQKCYLQQKQCNQVKIAAELGTH